jgi:predicted glycoside hydrolase/deacetylase ChbG (UPF0249 family)
MSAPRTLAERLGYSSDDRLLIVNCDDFGSSHAANLGVVDSLRHGIATSATLMVPCPAAREAVDLAGDWPVGVHLTLTSEYPDYRWRGLTDANSLHDASGYLPATAEAVHRQARVEDVRAECHAQVEQALAWGLDVTHIDAHMGTVQTHPAFLDVYVDLAAEFALPLRMVGVTQEADLGFPSRARATQRGLLYPDHFISPWGRPTREVLLESLVDLPPGVSEIYAHPVIDGPELRGYDPTHAGVRAADHACLLDPLVRATIERAGVRFISFRELRVAQRAADA